MYIATKNRYIEPPEVETRIMYAGLFEHGSDQIPKQTCTCQTIKTLSSPNKVHNSNSEFWIYSADCAFGLLKFWVPRNSGFPGIGLDRVHGLGN